MSPVTSKYSLPKAWAKTTKNTTHTLQTKPHLFVVSLDFHRGELVQVVLCKCTVERRRWIRITYSFKAPFQRNVIIFPLDWGKSIKLKGQLADGEWLSIPVIVAVDWCSRSDRTGSILNSSEELLSLLYWKIFGLCRNGEKKISAYNHV